MPPPACPKLSAPRTLELMLRYYETPHHDSVTCRFDGDQVEIGFVNSMLWMGGHTTDKRRTVQGKAIKG